MREIGKYFTSERITQELYNIYIRYTGQAARLVLLLLGLDSWLRKQPEVLELKLIYRVGHTSHTFMTLPFSIKATGKVAPEQEEAERNMLAEVRRQASSARKQ